MSIEETDLDEINLAYEEAAFITNGDIRMAKDAHAFFNASKELDGALTKEITNLHSQLKKVSFFSFSSKATLKSDLKLLEQAQELLHSEHSKFSLDGVHSILHNCSKDCALYTKDKKNALESGKKVDPSASAGP